MLTSCIGVFDSATKITDIAGERLEVAAAESFSVNVTSLLLAVRASAGQPTANHGRVIATGSFASFEPSGGGALYTAVKHGVVGAVRQLAYELAPLVRVNCVAPGVADTVITGLSALAQQPQAAVLNGTEAALPLRHVPNQHFHLRRSAQTRPGQARPGQPGNASTGTGTTVGRPVACRGSCGSWTSLMTTTGHGERRRQARITGPAERVEFCWSPAVPRTSMSAPALVSSRTRAGRPDTTSVRIATPGAGSGSTAFHRSPKSSLSVLARAGTA